MLLRGLVTTRCNASKNKNEKKKNSQCLLLLIFYNSPLSLLHVLHNYIHEDSNSLCICPRPILHGFLADRFGKAPAQGIRKNGLVSDSPYARISFIKLLTECEGMWGMLKLQL